MPLGLFAYLLCLYIHQLCQRSLEVTERSILVISGCHHKRLRATSLSSQKGPCIPTKKPLLCNALMLPLPMLFLTMIKSRRKTGGNTRGWGARVRQGVGEMSREEVCVGWAVCECVCACMCFIAHKLHWHSFLYFMCFHPVLHSVLHWGQQHTAAWHHWQEEENDPLSSSLHIKSHWWSDAPSSQVCACVCVCVCVCVWLLLLHLSCTCL